jgi:hypothetical protein
MGHLVDDDLTFVTQKVLGDIDTEEVHGPRIVTSRSGSRQNKPYAGTSSAEKSVSERERSVVDAETAVFGGERPRIDYSASETDFSARWVSAAA